MRILKNALIIALALLLSLPVGAANAENKVGTVYTMNFKKIADSDPMFSCAQADSGSMTNIRFLNEYIEDGKNLNGNGETDGLTLDGEYVEFYFIERNRKELCIEGHVDKRNLVVFTPPCAGRYIYNLELHPWYFPENADARVDIIVGNEKNGYRTVKSHKYVSPANALRTESVEVGPGEKIYFSFYSTSVYIPFAVTQLELKLLKISDVQEIEETGNNEGLDPAMIGGLCAVFIAAGISVTTAIVLALKKKKNNK